MDALYVWQRDMRLMRGIISSFALTILGALVSLAIFAPTINRLLPLMSFGATQVSYLQFYIPGSLILAAFTAGIFSGRLIQHDRREGMLQVMATSAISRRSLALGKILSGVTRAMLTVCGVLLAVTLVGFRFDHPVEGTVGLLGMTLLISWTFSALSASIAFSVRHRTAYDLLVASLNAPLAQLAAITYPATALPNYLQVFARLNPLTYAADAVREAVIYGTVPSVWNLSVPLAVAVISTLWAMHVAQNMTGDQLWVH